MTTESPSRGLQTGVRREHLMDLVERLARPLGLTPTAILHLRALARAAAHADWVDQSGPGPRCYVRQADFADCVGVGRSTANRIERRLQKMGFVIIRRLDNNHRSGRTGVVGETGVFPAPMIERYAELVALSETLDAEERYRKAAYGRASTARAELRAALRLAVHSAPTESLSPAIREAQRVYDAAPRRLAKIRDRDALHAIARILADALREPSDAPTASTPSRGSERQK
ncbi:MAG: helix-turn-helix domain-containing protein [Pseudomonadota bacterium]